MYPTSNDPYISPKVDFIEDYNNVRQFEQTIPPDQDKELGEARPTKFLDACKTTLRIFKKLFIICDYDILKIFFIFRHSLFAA
tara:strand:+ start:416 stop:664 length:249 start_codon:yes stop_codon:yes gene_type:complete